MNTEYYQIPPDELGRQSKIPLLKLGDSGEVFYEMALEMVRTILENNAAKKCTMFICPVGPAGQYPVFVRLVNRDRVSLKNTWFINMDEYLNDDGTYIDTQSPLSFRGFMEREVYGRIDPDLVMPERQRVFPDPNEPERVARVIGEAGGVDIVFGGIGVNGHLAFNEPQPDLTPQAFAALPARVLDISLETRTTNSIGNLGGAIDAMPKQCVTVGMAEMLGAKKIRVGVFRDWHRAVVRRAAYGEISAAFPATLLQTHPDAMIYVNTNAAKQPF